MQTYVKREHSISQQFFYMNPSTSIEHNKYVAIKQFSIVDGKQNNISICELITYADGLF